MNGDECFTEALQKVSPGNGAYFPLRYQRRLRRRDRPLAVAEAEALRGVRVSPHTLRRCDYVLTLDKGSSHVL